MRCLNCQSEAKKIANATKELKNSCPKKAELIQKADEKERKNLYCNHVARNYANELKEHNFERRICPFCGQAHIGQQQVDTICSCGSKYYSSDNEWVNRETGETKKGRK